jgi:uncharacterized protein (TIGR02757 family)
LKIDRRTAQLLNEKAVQYNRPEFIEEDPIQVPHLFSQPENIEISGFLTATIAWGQRKTIISNARRLISLMDNEPARFLAEASEEDFKVFNHFRHRTFSPEDCKFFLKSLQNIYQEYGGLRTVFETQYEQTGSIKEALIKFRKIYFELPHLLRTEKHIADIRQGSSGKRLNLFLRWMVRKDENGVDFGLWDRMNPADLFIPLDVHAGRVARNLGLLKRKQNDWQSVEELTAALRQLDNDDPVKYDYALFGLGIFEGF